MHCAAGVSRSATFVLGFLMRHRGLSLSAALSKLQNARPEVSPNPGFRKQLEEYERIGCDQSKWTPWNQVWGSYTSGSVSTSSAFTLNPFSSFNRSR